MRHIWWTFIAIVCVLLAALYIDLPKTTSAFGHSVQVNKGIDLAGGVRLLLCAPVGTSEGDMAVDRDVIAARAAGGLGVTEPQVNRVGPNCISVELPGLSNKDQQTISDTIGKVGYLALTDSAGTSISRGAKVKLVCAQAGCASGIKTGTTDVTKTPAIMQIVVPGKYIKRGSAQVSYDQTTGGAVVDYTLEGPGSDKWCTFTTNNVNKYSAIVLDNKVVSDPVIQGAICGGQTRISGIGTTDEAKTLATYLNYGALSVPLKVDSSQQVAASLGPEYVSAAEKAGIIGLIIVALFMLLYYRLPGLLADIALLMYAAIVFAVFKLVGVTLTLAGIAGFILSIGMAVDANVLIFERLKEELRAGKTLGSAVESGFRRAWPSIRDSNASTIITTVILFWFGHNFAATVITGFATTLFLGVVISMLTAVFVSHTFLRLMVLSGHARNPNLFGAETPVQEGRVA
ncbi:MAG: protein translocase subunit SecD [Chloroflexota bacterium]